MANNLRRDRRTVLVVDDDVRTVNLIRIYLERDGHEVITASDGLRALALAREADPDLIILDLMLPGIDGLEICRLIRSESMVPIIMLTARTTEESRIGGLDAGADDYVVKPFSPGELAARARAALRRLPDPKAPRGSPQVTYGGLIVNFSHQTVAVDGETVSLTPVEFRLLAALMIEPDRPFSRGHLVEQVFGYDYEGGERCIDVHVMNLRCKLESDRSRPVYIQTVFGVGYKFSSCGR
ncbi:MAG: response regulator transcription factor [Spirochaetaceae bacterium]|nr:response regulator transcription factor [Spirochaetaceae bacterium]